MKVAVTYQFAWFEIVILHGPTTTSKQLSNEVAGMCFREKQGFGIPVNDGQWMVNGWLVDG